MTEMTSGNGATRYQSEKVRVAIVGVGNCASSFVQGVEYYKDADPKESVPGLMHVDLGGYHVRDIEFTCAFDINETKVGKDLGEAIWAEPNNTIKFTEVPKVGKGGQHQTAIPSDLDGDGKLDLAVVSYPLEGRVPSSYLQADNGEPPELWLGNGDFTFHRLELPKSVAQRHWSFGGVAADLLGTGRMQLYVVNDYGVKDLYVIDRDGGVTEGAGAAGLQDPGPGMSVDLGDVNQDGKVDVYVANMFSKAGTRIMNGAGEMDSTTRQLMTKFVRGNTLFMSQPDGGYSDLAEGLEVHRALWSFASLLTDIDNDSHLEVLVANGFVSAPIRKDL